MKRSYLLGAVCAFVITVLSTSVYAVLVVPVGLDEGDTCHVIFVSSTTRDASSANITDYDAHVQGAADAALIGVNISVRRIT